MARPSWHRQAGLEADVNAVRPDLDHEVRFDMMLGIALAMPGHHIPSIMSLGGLSARRTSSSAHHLSTSYKCAKAGQASRSSRAALCCASWTGTRPQVSAVSPTTEPGHAVPCWLGIAALIVRSAGSRHFVSQNVTTIYVYLRPVEDVKSASRGQMYHEDRQLRLGCRVYG